ncbi:Rieske 2Fe-2S domain-containing protein [Belnapia sp. T6]|uniref:Rieske 2Fe-2S domain-containing protein n=1 Tax=Belnapia mucosa TaxID=2804532 RepID=A0ABS1V5R8_9PROT|nr:Rieske 2Fe-2S domain-containing protein [Belnapia mucosa]MBL6457031.1 Rieske 2Fe-2S domain-containing protein [Belnapia mucosa]
MAEGMDFAGLVDLGAGTVERAAFTDPAIFAAEQERIFARAWLFLGHESQIPEPEDFFTSRMGTESVIVARDRDGQVHALLNSCTHRGMKVCRHDYGKAKVFTCPYHGWSFSNDGRLAGVPGALVGVPHFDKAYRAELRREDWGLSRAPRLALYKGTIWASWDQRAPDFLDYLGDMHRYLDYALDARDGSPGGSRTVAGVQKWRVNCNWKFAPENFIGDMYHDISHRSVDMVGIGPAGGRGRRAAFRPRLAIGFPGRGHGLLGELPTTETEPYNDAWALYPEVNDWHRAAHEARMARLAGQPRVAMSVGTIFPNMSFHGRQPRTIAVAHPVSPTVTEIWRWCLEDAAAPEAVNEAARSYFLRYSGPGGMTESDDMENWSYATTASQGPIARRRPYNYQMGMGHARPAPGLREAVECGELTEENARIFHGRWADFMRGTPWPMQVPHAAE